MRQDRIQDNDSRNCKRAFDCRLVQMDYIICDIHMEPKLMCNDLPLATSVDHRDVHPQVEMVVPKPAHRYRNRGGFRGWHPFLDDALPPDRCHSMLTALVDQHPFPTLETTRNMVRAAGQRTGRCNRDRPKFLPSLQVQQWHQQQRSAANGHPSKSLSLQNFSDSTVKKFSVGKLGPDLGI